MNRVTGILRNNPAQEIILCASGDALCEYCPHQRGGVCESEEKTAAYDAKCLSLCGFHIGQRLSWDLFRTTVADEILKSSKLSCVCKECGWLPLCEKVGRNAYEKER